MQQTLGKANVCSGTGSEHDWKAIMIVTHFHLFVSCVCASTLLADMWQRASARAVTAANLVRREPIMLRKLAGGYVYRFHAHGSCCVCVVSCPRVYYWTNRNAHLPSCRYASALWPQASPRACAASGLRVCARGRPSGPATAILRRACPASCASCGVRRAGCDSTSPQRQAPLCSATGPLCTPSDQPWKQVSWVAALRRGV